jgi:hypothetical protein
MVRPSSESRRNSFFAGQRHAATWFSSAPPLCRYDTKVRKEGGGRKGEGGGPELKRDCAGNAPSG